MKIIKIALLLLSSTLMSQQSHAAIFSHFDSGSAGLVNLADGSTFDTLSVTGWNFQYDEVAGDGLFSMGINSALVGNVSINDAQVSTNSNGSLHMEGYLNLIDTGASAFFMGDMVVDYEYIDANDATIFNFSTIEFGGVGHDGLLVLDPPYSGFVLDFDIQSSFLAYVDNPFPTYSPVPVPAAAWLFMSGLVSLILVRRKR